MSNSVRSSGRGQLAIILTKSMINGLEKVFVNANFIFRCSHLNTDMPWFHTRLVNTNTRAKSRTDNTA